MKFYNLKKFIENDFKSIKNPVMSSNNFKN